MPLLGANCLQFSYLAKISLVRQILLGINICFLCTYKNKPIDKLGMCTSSLFYFQKNLNINSITNSLLAL